MAARTKAAAGGRSSKGKTSRHQEDMFILSLVVVFAALCIVFASLALVQYGQ